MCISLAVIIIIIIIDLLVPSSDEDKRKLLSLLKFNPYIGPEWPHKVRVSVADLTLLKVENWTLLTVQTEETKNKEYLKM